MSSSSSTSIAILDEYANIAKPHFQHIEGLKIDSFPETLDPKTPDGLSKLAEQLKPYPVISTMRERTPFPADLIKQLPNLKLVLTTGMKNAAFDMAAFAERGVVVTGATGARPKPNDAADGAPLQRVETGTLPPPPQHDSTTQHTWALLLALCARIPQDDHAVKRVPGAWQSGMTVALGGKTLGLCGLGRLGTNTARIGVQAFGMKVVAWSASLTQEKADAAAEGAGLPKGSFRAVGKEELFREADVVSLHYVLSARSKGVVGSKELSLMKKSAVLVNTSRGPLIDETDLLGALEVGAIRGFATDVYWQEPLPDDSPWRKTAWGEDGRSEVVLSPHMGYVNEGTMNRWYQEQAENVQRWVKGEEVVNKIG